ncbi:MAG: hypothetical protein M5T61_09710 [Acidimicrobiia bacterium]|nr:hypothetical protein [Acidimicrobiia bacterium]
MTGQLRYTRDELLADHAYVGRIERNGVLFHGGYDATGTYLPPRSLHRAPAIAAWTASSKPTDIRARSSTPAPSHEPSCPTPSRPRCSCATGATGAMTRILTLIGVVEGFGNDGIKLIPTIDLHQHIVEPIDDTCVGHLFNGLLEAHGNDEAGRDEEAGHDQMWFAVRDAALADPPVTLDMFHELPIAPPPATAAPHGPHPRPSASAPCSTRCAMTSHPSCSCSFGPWCRSS